MIGPGKYDRLTTMVRLRAEAEAAIVVILDGNQGSGFSVQARARSVREVAEKLPAILREMAYQIESDGGGHEPAP